MDCSGPSDGVADTVPQSSLAVALPRAASICDEDGLHPSGVLFPLAVITGGVVDDDHVTVLDVVAELPQASVDVQVLVWLLRQPLDCSRPSTGIADTVPQLSVALALPSAALISAADGLHPAGSGV